MAADRTVREAFALFGREDLLAALPPREERLSPGQLRAFHAKCTELDRRNGDARGNAKAAALAFAGERFGRELTSANDLSSEEASTLLDWLEQLLYARV